MGAWRFHCWFYLVAFFGYAVIPLIVFGVEYPYYMLGVTLTIIGAMSTVAAVICVRLGVKAWVRERDRERKSGAGNHTL